MYAAWAGTFQATGKKLSDPDFFFSEKLDFVNFDIFGEYTILRIRAPSSSARGVTVEWLICGVKPKPLMSPAPMHGANTANLYSAT